MSLAPVADHEPIYGLAYARISGSKEQKDSALSIPAQNRFVLEAFEREGVIFVDKFSDILKGTREDRPGYQHTLATARKLRMEGKRVAIGVLRLDRFGRKSLERARVWEELHEKQIQLYSVSNGGWQNDAFLYDLDSALAAREIRMNSDRVRDINEFIRRNGFPVIGRLPWGYRLRDATDDERRQGSGHKTYEPHPDEAPSVVQAFEMRARGASYLAIHDWVRSLPEAARGGRSMPYSNILKLFAMGVYVARQDYPEDDARAAVPLLERERCKWPALVSDELHLAASKVADEHKRLPRQASGQYLLTGLLRCPNCGDRLCGRPGYRGRKPNYWCISVTRGTAHRDGPPCYFSLKAPTVDALALAWAERLFAAFERPEIREAIEEGWRRVLEEAEAEDDTPRRIGLAEARRAKYATARDAAYIDWKAGEISAEQYRSVAATAEGEIAVADRELARLRAAYSPAASLPAYGEVLALLHGWSGGFAQGGTAEQRLILAKFWESVTPRRVGHGEYVLEPKLTDTGYRLAQMAANLAGEGWDAVYRSERSAGRRRRSRALRQ